MDKEEVPQVVHESTPISPSDFKKIQEEMYSELDDGMLSDEAFDLLTTKQEEIERHMVLNDSMGDELPNNTDSIITNFKPDELMLIKEVLVKHCTDGNQTLDYCSGIMGEDDRFKQQGIIRELIETIDMNLDNYVKLRPYSPFFVSWVKKVGKKDVIKM